MKVVSNSSVLIGLSAINKLDLLHKRFPDGEAEVIALGQEIKADLLLLDEKSARNAAFRLQYPVLGTVGILIWAKHMQVISSLKQELDSLQQKGGFRLSQKVYNYAISRVY